MSSSRKWFGSRRWVNPDKAAFWEMQKHKGDHEYTIHQCPDCSATFRKEEAYKDHWKAMHAKAAAQKRRQQGRARP